MAEDGRVLIVERLIPDDPAEAVPVLLSDLNMLVFTGGQAGPGGPRPPSTWRSCAAATGPWSPSTMRTTAWRAS
jgi:hypothetical protein